MNITKEQVHAVVGQILALHGKAPLALSRIAKMNGLGAEEMDALIALIERQDYLSMEKTPTGRIRGVVVRRGVGCVSVYDYRQSPGFTRICDETLRVVRELSWSDSTALDVTNLHAEAKRMAADKDIPYINLTMRADGVERTQIIADHLFKLLVG